MLLHELDKEINNNRSVESSDGGGGGASSSSAGSASVDGESSSSHNNTNSLGSTDSAAAKSEVETSALKLTANSNNEADTPRVGSSLVKCSLCIDFLTHPAVVPCGHIFCWDCIVSYTRSSGARSSGAGSGSSSGSGGSDNSASSGTLASGTGTGAKVKCPMCRAEFPSQKIRALYQYA